MSSIFSPSIWLMRVKGYIQIMVTDTERDVSSGLAPIIMGEKFV